MKNRAMNLGDDLEKKAEEEAEEMKQKVLD